jgi:DNA-binding CsgD family transcriptional regulator
VKHKDVILTDAQLRVLGGMAGGYNERTGAELLGISPSTWRTHKRNIHRALGVRTGPAAVAQAHRLGILPKEGWT